MSTIIMQTFCIVHTIHVLPNTMLSQRNMECYYLKPFFDTQGNMKIRGPGGNAKSSVAVGAGDARVVKL